jgi:hypothetical protein
MPLFLFIFIFYNIHTFIQSQYFHSSAFAEASLHVLIACMLSGEDLPAVSSRESNSGLPYSKPTRCQLSHAAPYLAQCFNNKTLYKIFPIQCQKQPNFPERWPVIFYFDFFTLFYVGPDSNLALELAILENIYMY